MVKSKRASTRAGKSAAAGGKKSTTAARITDVGWRRTETCEGDLRKLCDAGLIPQDKEAVKIPGDKVIPRPPVGFG